MIYISSFEKRSSREHPKSGFLRFAARQRKRADKKDFFVSFRMDLNSRTKSRRRRAYHQNEVLYITKAKALYIIIAKEDTACG